MERESHELLLGTLKKTRETVFFYAEVTTARLRALTEMFEQGKISARVGSVLPPEEARRAHEMLAGAPHEPGKIVLHLRRWNTLAFVEKIDVPPKIVLPTMSVFRLT